MCFKACQNLPENGFVSLVITGDADVGIPVIQGCSVSVEIFQILARGHGDSARVHVLDSLDEQGQGQLQEDGDAPVLEMGHGLGAVHHTSAGCDDVPFQPQRQNVGLLDLEKVGQPLLFEDRLKHEALLGLNVDVRVQEGAGQFLGKENPERALSSPGHPDEHDIRTSVHVDSLAKYREYGRNINSFLALVQVFGAREGDVDTHEVIPKCKKEEAMAQKVVIDADECVACGTCVEVCPDVFKMDDGADFAEVIKETGGPEDLIQEAIDSCPTQCISLED